MASYNKLYIKSSRSITHTVPPVPYHTAIDQPRLPVSAIATAIGITTWLMCIELEPTEHRSASQLAEIKRQRGNQKITAFFTPPSKRAVPDGATSASADRGTTHDRATSTSGDLAMDTRDGSTGASDDLSTTEPITHCVPSPAPWKAN